jgi:hypothetical protein
VGSRLTLVAARLLDVTEATMLTNEMGVSMTRSRIIWLIGLLVALSLLLVPGASA